MTERSRNKMVCCNINACDRPRVNRPEQETEATTSLIILHISEHKASAASSQDDGERKHEFMRSTVCARGTIADAIHSTDRTRAKGSLF